MKQQKQVLAVQAAVKAAAGTGALRFLWCTGLLCLAIIFYVRYGTTWPETGNAAPVAADSMQEPFTAIDNLLLLPGEMAAYEQKIFFNPGLRREHSNSDKRTMIKDDNREKIYRAIYRKKLQQTDRSTDFSVRPVPK